MTIYLNSKDNIKTELERRLANTNGAIDALKKIERKKTKDNKDFKILSKNFTNCTFFKEYDMDKLRVNYATKYRMYNDYQVYIYGYLDELPDNDERKKDYVRQFIRQKYILTADEIEKRIAQNIEKLEQDKNELEKQLKELDVHYSFIEDKVNEINKYLKENCQDEDGHANALYYMLSKF